MLNSLTNYFINLIETFGYIGLFITVLLEYSCFPLPSEVLLPFLGLLSSYGSFNLILCIFISILAGVIGSIICYYIGYYGGTPVIVWIEKKLPSSKKAFIKLNHYINRYDKISIFFTRLLPLTRTYVSLLAGAVRIKFSTFIGFSILGISLWNTILILLGYSLGENTEVISSIIKDYSVIMFAVIIILLTLFIISKAYKRKKN